MRIGLSEAQSPLTHHASGCQGHQKCIGPHHSVSALPKRVMSVLRNALPPNSGTGARSTGSSPKPAATRPHSFFYFDPENPEHVVEVKVPNRKPAVTTLAPRSLTAGSPAALVRPSSNSLASNDEGAALAKSATMQQELLVQLEAERSRVAELMAYESLCRDWRVRVQKTESELTQLQRTLTEKNAEISSAYKLLAKAAAERLALDRRGLILEAETKSLLEVVESMRLLGEGDSDMDGDVGTFEPTSPAGGFTRGPAGTNGVPEVAADGASSSSSSSARGSGSGNGSGLGGAAASGSASSSSTINTNTTSSSDSDAGSKGGSRSKTAAKVKGRGTGGGGEVGSTKAVASGQKSGSGSGGGGAVQGTDTGSKKSKAAGVKPGSDITSGTDGNRNDVIHGSWERFSADLLSEGLSGSTAPPLSSTPSSTDSEGSVAQTKARNIFWPIGGGISWPIKLGTSTEEELPGKQLGADSGISSDIPGNNSAGSSAA